MASFGVVSVSGRLQVILVDTAWELGGCFGRQLEPGPLTKASAGGAQIRKPKAITGFILLL